MNLQRAIEIAVNAHKGQFDKAGAPYILHPLRIMFSLKTDAEKIVGVLHDVVEDSEWTFEDIKREGFSDIIIEALRSVTAIKGEEYEAFILRAKLNKIGKNVKTADLIDNMDIKRIDDLTERDLERLKKYRKALKIISAD